MTAVPALVWVVRAAWVVLPLVAGPALGDGLAAHPRAVEVAGTVGAWTAWTAGAAALLAPRPLGLTALRLLGPGVLAAALAASMVAAAPLAVAVGAVVAGLLFVPVVADAFVDGASYGDERRFLLRAPGPVLLVAPVVTVAVLAGAAAGPLLLAGERWVAGGIATAVGLPVAAAGARVLHQLSRRWLVFVPAGFVVHDPLALGEPVLFRRNRVAAIGPAPATTEALDLTQRALGLALEVRLVEFETLLVRRTGPGREAEALHVKSFLVTPARPGAVLATARERRLAVG